MTKLKWILDCSIDLSKRLGTGFKESKEIADSLYESFSEDKTPEEAAQDEHHARSADCI
jgi:hypothetical protein